MANTSVTSTRFLLRRPTMTFANPEIDSTRAGQRCFASQFGPTDLKHLAEIFKVNKVFGEDNWEEEINKGQQNGHCYTMVPYTAEDYNLNVGNMAVQSIDGSKMMPTWSHVMATTSLHDAATMMGYHLSQLHTTTGNMRQFYIVVIKIDTINFAVNMEQEVTSIFNRGGCSTLIQFHKMYQLSPSEIAQQVHLEFNGYIPNIFKTYSWATGFAWTYHVVLNINDVLANMENDNYYGHYAFQQCLEYGGTTMLDKLDATTIQQVIHYVNRFGISLEPNTMQTENHIRGSATHPDTMAERIQQGVLQQRMAQLAAQHHEPTGPSTAMPAVGSTEGQQDEVVNQQG